MRKPKIFLTLLLVFLFSPALSFSFVLYEDFPFSLFVLYDDFSGAFLDTNKWKQGEFVREVDVANHRLLSKLGTPSPITIDTYPYRITNDLIFWPQPINSIQADVSILQKKVVNNAPAKAVIGGRWYHYYTTQLDQGYVWGEVAIKGDATGLKATWSVLKSSDPYYSVWETLGSGDFTTIIDVSTTYTLYIGYDVDGNQFIFKVGTEEQTFGPTGLPDRDGIGIDAWKFLLTEAEVGDSTSSGYIFATFSNVYVNDSIYEDFSSVILDPTKWISYSTIDSEIHGYDEFVREISGGSFRSKIRSQSHDASEVYSRLEFINPSSIRFIKTKVTPMTYQNEDNRGARVEARIAGRFYNDGTSNIGYAGEVEAEIWIGGNWNGGGTTPAAHWLVEKYLDSAGSYIQILDQGTFTTPITLRNTYVLSLGWNENQLTFRIEDAVTEAFEEDSYTPATSINPPNIPWKEIGTYVYSTALESTIEALFDDVIIDEVEEPCTFPSIITHPKSQTIQSGKTATFSVTASGTTPFTYQWYQGSSGNTSTPVGINSSSYTTPALTQTTAYWVKVTNFCGSTSSNTATTVIDKTPPSPNPMTFATLPHQTGTNTISMVATTATDPTLPVSYFFDFVSSPTGGSGGKDSGWQSGTSYADSKLKPNHRYGYRVKAKDGLNKQTAYSSTKYAYTAIEAPTGIIFGAITSSGIQVRSTNTPSGLAWGTSGLWIENTTNGTNSAWKQSNSFWTNQSLSPNTSYSFRVKARNGDRIETDYGPSASKYTRAKPPGVASFSNVTPTSIRVNWTANGNPSGTRYMCQNITTGTNSGWITNTYWDSGTLNPGRSYSFRVKVKNEEGIETGWTSLGKQSTQKSIIIIQPNGG